MIGIGIDLDLTTAAVKAVRDAMDRNACFADYDSSSPQQNHRLHVQLGVPSPKPVLIYPLDTSSETSVVSPTHEFDKEITVPKGTTNCKDEMVGGVNLMQIFRQLFPKTYGQVLQPVFHLEVGGLHLPATTLDQNNRIVENYAFPSRPETYVVIASLLFRTFERPKEQLLQGYKCSFSTNNSEVLNHLLQRHTGLEELSVSSKNVEFATGSPRDETVTTEAVTSSRLHGFHLSTSNETSNDFSAYSRSFEKPNLINKCIVLADGKRPVWREQPKQNPFTSFDMLAHISVAMMNERYQALDDAGNLDEESALKSTDNDQNHQDGLRKGDVGRSVQSNNHNSVAFKKLPPGKTPKNHVRHFVRHSYRDFSQEIPLHADREKHNVASSNSAFPIKLHETLSQIASDGFDHVIGWLSHGRSFKIHRNYEFVEVVLPQYFVMTKKSSFLRQLNLYGFRRISDGSYYHERFLRGMKFLCYPMQRQKVNGNGIRAAGNPNEEPNFSKYPTCPPHSPSSANSKIQPSFPMKTNIGNACSRDFESLEKRIVSLSKPPLTQQVRDIIQSEKLQFIYESYSSGEEEQAAQSGNSHEESNDETISVDSSTSIAAKLTARLPSGGRPRRQVSFPLKLQRILDQLERDGQDDVLSWLPHGRAFIVHDVERFVEEILPLHFNQTKYSSFQRQCHMYHMLRISNGADKGAYYHHQFQRGRPDLAITMTRTRVNGNGTRQPSNPNLEPNLYILPPLPSL